MLFYVVAVVLVAVVGAQDASQKVKVQVYYESLCPDSIKFFNKQLYPTLQSNLSSYIDLELLPYGKSKHTRTTEYEFECHHGPDECVGNKIQACALRKIDEGRNTPSLGFNNVTVSFINCLMEKVNRNEKPVKFPTMDCAVLSSVRNLNDITNCAGHPDGSNFLVHIGTITESLQPPLTSVPTIVFNQAFTKTDSDNAQEDFKAVLCGKITGNKPVECSGAGHYTAGFLLLVIAVFINKIF